MKCDSKPAPKKFVSKAKGKEGQVANPIFYDESGKIRCTMWTDEIAKYYDMIQPGKCYVISNCDIKPKNKWNFTNLNVELSFNRKSKITETTAEDLPSLPPVAEIKELDAVWDSSTKNYSSINVFGIVLSDEVVSVKVQNKKGEEIYKHEFFIIDKHLTKTKCMYWTGVLSEKIERDIFKGNPIFIIQGSVREWRGDKSIMIQNNSKVVGVSDRKLLSEEQKNLLTILDSGTPQKISLRRILKTHQPNLTALLQG